MNEEKRVKLLSWGIALLVHILALMAAASAGLFLMVREPAEPAVVDVAVLPAGSAQQEDRGRGGESSPSQPVPSGGAAGMTMPTMTDVPLIQENYTRNPEVQENWRREHQTSETRRAVAASDPSAAAAAGRPGNGMAGTAGGTEAAGPGEGSAAESGNGSSAGGDVPAAPKQTERIAAVCTYRPAPAYPESLRAQGAEGRVQVRILVAADDSIESVELLQSSGYPAMDQAALQAASGCHFQMNGYRGRYTTTYRFSLLGSDDW